jgi:hypothetical protein
MRVNVLRSVFCLYLYQKRPNKLLRFAFFFLLVALSVGLFDLKKRPNKFKRDLRIGFLLSEALYVGLHLSTFDLQKRPNKFKRDLRMGFLLSEALCM